MTIQYRLRQAARFTRLDADKELLTEAADELDRLSAGQQAEATDIGIVACAKAAAPEASSLDAAHIAKFLPVWRKFARAVLALRPVQVPMTDEQATAMIREAVRGNAIRREGSTSLQIVRATEAHHGITAQAKKETP